MPTDLPILSFDFPTFKHWKMDTKIRSNSNFIPDDSKMAISLDNFDFGMISGLKCSEKGFLRP